jgi:hypothetical protein
VLALILKTILGCIPDIYLRIVNGYHQIVLTDDEQIDPLIFFGRTRGALRLRGDISADCCVSEKKPTIRLGLVHSGPHHHLIDN